MSHAERDRVEAGESRTKTARLFSQNPATREPTHLVRERTGLCSLVLGFPPIQVRESPARAAASTPRAHAACGAPAPTHGAAVHRRHSHCTLDSGRAEPRAPDARAQSPGTFVENLVCEIEEEGIACSTVPPGKLQEKKIQHMRGLLLFVSACCLLAPAAAVMNIVQTANTTADLSTLVKALAAAGLDGTLSGEGPFTVFAPTDLAFAELPAGTLSYLLDPRNVKELQALLLYHVLNGNVPSTDLGPLQNVSTVNGDQVLVVTNQSAPAPYGRLQVFVNQAQVQVADVGCTNGFVHIIHSVLIPPGFPRARFVVPVAAAVQTVGPLSTMNIVQTANATADLSTLVKALQAARLADTLSGPGPFTVFAPTDLAFDKLPAATLSMLLQPINIRKLQDLLLYHVVSGSLHAADFGPRQNVTTVNGAQVLVVTNQSAPAPYGRLQVFVNQAQVQAADVGCTNGLVHIINSVLIPPGFL